MKFSLQTAWTCQLQSIWQKTSLSCLSLHLELFFTSSDPHMRPWGLQWRGLMIICSYYQKMNSLAFALIFLCVSWDLNGKGQTHIFSNYCITIFLKFISGSCDKHFESNSLSILLMPSLLQTIIKFKCISAAL